MARHSIGKAIVLVTILFSVVQCAIATEPRETGGIVGLGVGVHRINASTGVMTSFVLGKKLVPNVALHWSADITWIAPDTKTYVGGFFAVGATYYLSSSAPSLFLRAGAGYNTASGSAGEGDFWNNGFGLAAALGYEFDQIISASIGVRTGEYFPSGRSSTLVSTQLTLNVLFPVRSD
jgi:hypothetical protein